jgi:hypothetical protein
MDTKFKERTIYHLGKQKHSRVAHLVSHIKSTVAGCPQGLKRQGRVADHPPPTMRASNHPHLFTAWFQLRRPGDNCELRSTSRGGPVSNPGKVMWDLWWTQRHWAGFIPVLLFP